jgi:hypothetical protein
MIKLEFEKKEKKLIKSWDIKTKKNRGYILRPTLKQ